MFMPGVWILWSKKKNHYFSKRKWKTFTLLIIFIVKSLQREQNSTNILLWPQSAGVNVQSLQSESTPRRLTLRINSCFQKYFFKLQKQPKADELANFAKLAKIKKRANLKIRFSKGLQVSTYKNSYYFEFSEKWAIFKWNDERMILNLRDFFQIGF